MKGKFENVYYESTNVPCRVEAAIPIHNGDRFSMTIINIRPSVYFRCSLELI